MGIMRYECRDLGAAAENENIDMNYVLNPLDFLHEISVKVELVLIIFCLLRYLSEWDTAQRVDTSDPSL